MTGWMTRLRRAAMLMLGLQILQIAVLAVSPVCEVMRNEASGSHGAHVTAHVTADATVHQHAEKHGASHADHLAPPQATTTPEDTHGEHAECPMAMLCAVTAVAGQAPTVRIVESRLAEHVPAYAPTAPLSAWRAPETPPPRA